MSRAIYLAIGTWLALPCRVRPSDAVSWAIVCGLMLGTRVAAAQAPPALPESWPEAPPIPIPIAAAAPVQERWYERRCEVAEV
jgi:hypothetical protein